MDLCTMICGGGEEQLIDTTHAAQQSQGDTCKQEDPFAAQDNALLATEPNSSAKDEPGALLDDFAAPSSSTPATRTEEGVTGDLIQF